MDYYTKKLNTRWNYSFVAPPMAEIPDKTKYHPYQFHRIVLQKHEIPRPKSKTSPHKFVYLGNSHCFLLTNHWKFHMLFLNTSGNWILSTPLLFCLEQPNEWYQINSSYQSKISLRIFSQAHFSLINKLYLADSQVPRQSNRVI